MFLSPAFFNTGVSKPRSVSTAIELLREFGVSQMPVLSSGSKAGADGAHPEVRVGDIIGSIRELHLLDEALKDPETMRKPVGEVMQPPLPLADTSGDLDQVFTALASGSEAVVVAEAGHAVGVLTRSDLLAHLAAHAGTVISKRELLTEVWQQPLGGGDRTVDVHLSWLRRKLGETAAAPRYLHTVRGVGIKLVAPEG